MSAAPTAAARALAGATAAAANVVPTGHVADANVSSDDDNHASRLAAAAAAAERRNGAPPHSTRSPTNAATRVVDPARPHARSVAVSSVDANAESRVERATPGPGRGERLQRRSAKHLDAVVVLDRVFRLVSVSRRLLVLVLVLVLVVVAERGARLERRSRSTAKFDAQVPSRGRKRPRVALLSRPRLGILSRDPTRSILRAHESRRFPRGENLFGARREKLGTLGFAQPSSPEFEPALPVRLRADLRPARLPLAHEKLPGDVVQRPLLDPRVRRRGVRLRRRAQEPRRDDEPRADSGRRLPRRRRASQRGETPRRRRGRRRTVLRRGKRGARERRQRPRARSATAETRAYFQQRRRARATPRSRRALQHRRQSVATLARHPQHRRRARSRRRPCSLEAVRDGGTRGVEDDVGDGRRVVQRRRDASRATRRPFQRRGGKMRHARRHRARVRVALERVEGVAHRASLRAESSGPGEVRGGNLRARGDQRGVQTRRRRRRRRAAAVSSRGGGGGGDGGGGGVVAVVLAFFVARDVLPSRGTFSPSGRSRRRPTSRRVWTTSRGRRRGRGTTPSERDGVPGRRRRSSGRRAGRRPRRRRRRGEARPTRASSASSSVQSLRVESERPSRDAARSESEPGSERSS